MKCKNCGADVGTEYRLCPYCRTELEYNDKNNSSQPPIIIQNIVNNATPASNTPVIITDFHSPKNRIVALILCIFLGMIGGHCFYAGKVGMGILYLFTGGLFCIGWIYDIIKIVSGTYKDGNGLPINK